MLLLSSSPQHHLVVNKAIRFQHKTIFIFKTIMFDKSSVVSTKSRLSLIWTARGRCSRYVHGGDAEPGRVHAVDRHLIGYRSHLKMKRYFITLNLHFIRNGDGLQLK